MSEQGLWKVYPLVDGWYTVRDTRAFAVQYDRSNKEDAEMVAAKLNSAERIRNHADELLTASARILDYLESSGQGDIPSAKNLRSAIQSAKGQT